MSAENSPPGTKSISSNDRYISTRANRKLGTAIMKKAMKLNTLSNRAYWRIAAPTPAGQLTAMPISMVRNEIATVVRMRSWITARTGRSQ